MDQGYKIHAMEIVDDHVHLFLEFQPSSSLSIVVQFLKGGSSYRMFKLHPELKKKDIGAKACGLVANSFDPLEM
jgi:putative transposase